MASTGDAESMPDDVKKLVEAQVKRYKDSAIFIAAMKAHDAPEFSLGLKMLKEQGVPNACVRMARRASV